MNEKSHEVESVVEDDSILRKLPPSWLQFIGSLLSIVGIVFGLTKHIWFITAFSVTAGLISWCAYYLGQALKEKREEDIQRHLILCKKLDAIMKKV